MIVRIVKREQTKDYFWTNHIKYCPNQAFFLSNENEFDLKTDGSVSAFTFFWLKTSIILMRFDKKE